MAILTIDETAGIQNTASNDTLLAMPGDFSSALGVATAATGQSATPAGVALSGYPASPAGSNILPFPPDVSEVAFQIDAADSGLRTAGDRKIFLYLDATDNNVVYGREANANDTANSAGRIAFALYLDTGTAAAGDAGSTGAKLWMAQYLPMEHANPNDPNDIVTLTGKLSVLVNNAINFTLEGAPSGQNLFLMFGDGDITSETEDAEAAVVVTGKLGNSVNTGQGGGMTTIGSNNQMIDPNEGMYFTFVKGPNNEYTVPNLDQNEADDASKIQFDSYLGSTSASFGMVQLQPPKAATLLLTAINNKDDEMGVDFIPGLTPNTDGSELVNITSVTISRIVKVGKNTTTESYVFIPPAEPASQIVTNNNIPGVTVDFTGSTAKVVGTVAGDRIKYTTDSNHNRVLIDNVGNSDAKLNSAFDIGGFRLESGDVTDNALGDVSWIDDAPTAVAALGAGQVRHDETAGAAADSGADDTTMTLTQFNGVLNPSGDMTPGFALGAATSVINSTGSAGGVDGLASTVYSLDVATAGVDSGLDTTEGNNILLHKEGDLVVGRISGGAYDLKAAFAVAIDAATGRLSMVQYHSIKHPTGGTGSYDESLAIANTALLAVVTVTDGDGDQDSEQVAIGARVQIQDDGPAITGVSNLTYANSSNPTPGGTGIFSYSIGVDDHKSPYSASNSDFSKVKLASGEVGELPISVDEQSVTWASESLTSAVFNVEFDYISNPALDTTTTAEGTLTFNKSLGTYTLSLDEPILSYSLLTTSNAIQFIGYAEGAGFVLDNTQPAVSIAQLSSDFFVQFSGDSEPGSGTGGNNLTATGKPGPSGAFVDGELFTQAASWVSISGVAAGVAGDTLQKGEVLDMDFFSDNPGGVTTLDPTTSAAGIFLKFDGINSEDLVVVLKLENPSDPTDTTTRAFVVDNADIFKAGSDLPDGYNITLDNNDGVVIFESNDYNGDGENYVIVGAQVLTPTETITGFGIDLNPATGENGGSDLEDTQNFVPGTTDNDVVKISDIGFLSSVTPDTHLVFNVAVGDADGDVTTDQVLEVTIEAGGEADLAIGLAGVNRILEGDINL